MAEALLDAEKANAENAQKVRINAALEEMIGQSLDPVRRNALAAYSPPVPDFLNIPVPPSYKELRQIITHLEKIEKKLMDTVELLEILKKYPHEIARCEKISRALSNSKLSAISIITLIGTHHAAMVSNLAIHVGVHSRLIELRELQRSHYPSGRGRKRNAHAYLIAEKLARFYANRCNKKPSFGTGDYRIPSTDYARALENIFGILGIQAALRGPAESAIAGLTPADINPKPALFNALSGVFSSPAN